MGVQVSLELATLHPERVLGLVLINGTYGHAFQSGFQPLAPLPFVGRWGHRAIEYLVEHPELTDKIAATYLRLMTPTLALFWLVSQTPFARMRPLLERYQTDVFGGANFHNYLRLFQELDAHSVYHHLKDIRVPALVVSGTFDVLTPAYQSRQIARRLADAEPPTESRARAISSCWSDRRWSCPRSSVSSPNGSAGSRQAVATPATPAGVLRQVVSFAAARIMAAAGCRGP